MKVISNSPAILHKNYPVGFKFYHPMYKTRYIVDHHAFTKDCRSITCYTQAENRKCDCGVVYCSEIDNDNNIISRPLEMCWSLFLALENKNIFDTST